jgi:hypothetical protein
LNALPSGRDGRDRKNLKMEATMGLDMYLEGRIDYCLGDGDPLTQPVQQVFRLGYWRKHPDLHGFIVNQFANGIDDGREIPLTSKDVLEIIKAVEAGTLPHTEGFFFGESSNDEESKAENIKILRRAINWLAIKVELSYRTAYYKASW